MHTCAVVSTDAEITWYWSGEEQHSNKARENEQTNEIAFAHLHRTLFCSLCSSLAHSLSYPHFDSPSIFASILDRDKGGFFSIRAAVEQGGGPNVTHRQLYHSETNVLISRFLTDSGVGQVIDYMPVGKACREGHGWLIRELECVRGKVRHKQQEA